MFMISRSKSLSSLRQHEVHSHTRNKAHAVQWNRGQRRSARPWRPTSLIVCDQDFRRMPRRVPGIGNDQSDSSLDQSVDMSMSLNGSDPEPGIEDLEPRVSIKLYTYVVPMFILACLVTFLMNLVVILAIPMISNVSRVTRPYLTFVLSLVISDAFASLLLGFQLLMGSYLPVVHGIHWNTCFLLISEGLKLSGVIVTVLHLLVMVSIHLAGVLNPVRFKEFLTQTVARIAVCVLWLFPFAGILLAFGSIPEQGFQSEGCGNHRFLSEVTFRSVFSALILVPTLSILGLYSYFHVILWGREVSVSSITRQNIRASKITFLIMITCTIGWIPAVINNLLICTDGCLIHPLELSSHALFTLHAIGNVLVIFKSCSNPLIFAFRQKHIRRSVTRLGWLLFRCRRLPKVELIRTSSHTQSSKRITLRASHNESWARGASAKLAARA